MTGEPGCRRRHAKRVASRRIHLLFVLLLGLPLMHPNLSAPLPCPSSPFAPAGPCLPGPAWYHACMHDGPANKLHRVATRLLLSLSCQVGLLKRSLPSFLCLLTFMPPPPPCPVLVHPSGQQKRSPSFILYSPSFVRPSIYPLLWHRSTSLTDTSRSVFVTPLHVDAVWSTLSHIWF